MKRTYIPPSVIWEETNVEILVWGMSVHITDDTYPYPEAGNEGLFDAEEDDNGHFVEYEKYINHKLWSK